MSSILACPLEESALESLADGNDMHLQLEGSRDLIMP